MARERLSERESGVVTWEGERRGEREGGSRRGGGEKTDRQREQMRERWERQGHRMIER
jgi:hypothetical protein